MTSRKTRIVIHYHRPDGDYDDLSLWCWSTRNPHPTIELTPVDFDSFGAIFHLHLPDLRIYNDEAAFGFVPRYNQNWAHRDGPDRYWAAEQGTEFWLIGEDRAVYRNKPETFPVVRAAWIDAPDEIVVRLSHKAPSDQFTPAQALVRRRKDGEIFAVRAIEPVGRRSDEDSRLVRLRTVNPLSPAETYDVGLGDYLPARSIPRGILQHHELPSKEPGYVYTPQRTTFRVFAPSARHVTIVNYDGPAGTAGRHELSLASIGEGMWEGSLEGDQAGRCYMVRVAAPGEATNLEVVDPYGLCNTGHDGRSLILPPRYGEPEGFRDRPRPEYGSNPVDAIIYEVSVRDLTIDPSSGVPENERGRYLGAARLDTVVPGTTIATGLDHIASLGVTHVQLLPIHDFDNDEDDREEYNWGYMSSHFFSPDGWYASNPRDGSRVGEFKALVHRAHECNLRVIMDVVFNHTAVNATFESVVPLYYYRLREDGSFWNGSGTGNEFRSESVMGRALIRRSCRLFAEDYRVDGYRFDLMALIDRETLTLVRDDLRKIDPTLLMYGEPWAATGQDGAGLNPLVYKDKLRGTGIGAFNDHYRNALKGSPDGDDGGWLQSGYGREGVKLGLEGSIHDWAKEPSEVINYVDCHDNLVLYDKLKRSLPDATEEMIIRVQALAAGVLAVSQGIMFLHAGHEFARTKQGNHNSYDAPDSINKMDWTLLERHLDLTEYVRSAIALRRRHRALRLHNRAEIESRLMFRDDLAPSEAVIVYTINAQMLEDSEADMLLIIINAGWDDADVALPEGFWVMEFPEFGHAEDPQAPHTKHYRVPAKSMAVFKR